MIEGLGLEWAAGVVFWNRCGWLVSLLFSVRATEVEVGCVWVESCSVWTPGGCRVRFVTAAKFVSPFFF